jgi:hypothetical protein
MDIIPGDPVAGREKNVQQHESRSEARCPTRNAGKLGEGVRFAETKGSGMQQARPGAENKRS